MEAAEETASELEVVVMALLVILSVVITAIMGLVEPEKGNNTPPPLTGTSPTICKKSWFRLGVSCSRRVLLPR